MNIFSKEALQSPITIFLIAGENKITKWEPKSGSPREPCFTAGNGTLKQSHRAIESSNALFRKKCSSWGVKTSGVHQRRGSTGSDHLVIITIRFEDMKQPYILFVSFIITVVFWWQKMGKQQHLLSPCCTKPPWPWLWLSADKMQSRHKVNFSSLLVTTCAASWGEMAQHFHSFWPNVCSSLRLLVQNGNQGSHHRNSAKHYPAWGAPSRGIAWVSKTDQPEKWGETYNSFCIRQEEYVCVVSSIPAARNSLSLLTQSSYSYLQLRSIHWAIH